MLLLLLWLLLLLLLLLLARDCSDTAGSHLLVLELLVLCWRWWWLCVAPARARESACGAPRATWSCGVGPPRCVHVGTRMVPCNIRLNRRFGMRRDAIYRGDSDGVILIHDTEEIRTTHSLTHSLTLSVITILNHLIIPPFTRLLTPSLIQ